MRRRIDRAQRQFLVHRRSLLFDRVRSRRIGDGHGDLRPEHIALGATTRIIDCLEFNVSLRVVDPLARRRRMSQIDAAIATGRDDRADYIKSVRATHASAVLT